MDVWFNVTRARCELFYEMKLRLYEEAVVSFLTSLYRDDNSTDAVMVKRMEQVLQASVQQNTLLTESSKRPKSFDCIDAIEEQLHVVFSGLANGYTITDDDKVAFEHAKFSNTMDNAVGVPVSSTALSCNPQLYGELTPKGVRQLHCTVLQCLERVGAVTHLGEVGKMEKNTRHLSQRCFHSLVAIDIGSGTGKLLFEWSLLSQRDARSFGWTHVGLELAPSRMRVARGAMPGSASLVYCQKRQRWCVERTCHVDEEAAARVVLGEVDVFAPGVLSNDTFFPIASDMAARAMSLRGSNKGCRGAADDDDDGDGSFCHLVVFFCGLGFAEPAVRELCAALEHMWLTPYISSSWQSLTCVFLLRNFAELHSFPLFSLCTKTMGHTDSSANCFYAVKLNTTWMNEAPAWVLSLCRVEG